MEEETKKTAEEWCAELGIDHHDILDPDGWDRKNYDESWNEKITKQEFGSRMASSTLRFSEPIRKFFGINQ